MRPKKRSMALQKKLFISILLFSILPLVIIFISFIITYQSDVVMNILNGKRNEIIILNDSANSWVNQYTSMVEGLFYDKTLNNILESDTEGAYGEAKYRVDMQQHLLSVYASRKDISSIFFVDSKNRVTSITDLGQHTVDKIISECEDRLAGENNTAVWDLVKTETGYRILFARRIATLDNVYNKIESGIVYILIDESSFYKLYSEVQENADSSFYFINADNKIISSGNREAVNTDFFCDINDLTNYDKIKIEDKNYIYINSAKTKNDWRIANLVPEASLNSLVYKTFTNILLLLVTLVFISMIIARMVSGNITKSLKLLSESMNNIKNDNFNTKIDIETDETVGALVDSYNEMVDMLHELINKNLANELTAKEAQLQAYERQVNPHFIYNTLDMIRMMSAFSEQDKLDETVVCLGKLLRFNNGTEKEVLIADEITSTEHYLKIIKLRYGDGFEYEIDIPEEIMGYYTLKFLLQPFIENAVKHSIEKTDSVTVISIKAKKMNDEIIFMIKDNGVGIPKEKIDEIMANIKASDIFSMEGENIGFTNVYQRIKLNYGSNFDIGIESRVNEKTTIYIHIPANKKPFGSD